jgi:AcrR family transcriptional regulator
VTDLHRRILDASLALIAEQGVRAVSFREVARRAGVSHQAPYHHFKNHHGILQAIAREGFAALTAAMREAAAAAGGDPLDALHAAGVAYVLFARDHVGHFRVMFQGSLMDIHEAVELMPEVEQTHATLVELASAAVKAGHGAGLSEAEVSSLCWSTVHGLANLLVEGTLRSKGVREEDHEALARTVVGALRRLLEVGASRPGGRGSRTKRPRRAKP